MSCCKVSSNGGRLYVDSNILEVAMETIPNEYHEIMSMAVGILSLNEDEEILLPLIIMGGYSPVVVVVV